MGVYWQHLKAVVGCFVRHEGGKVASGVRDVLERRMALWVEDAVEMVLRSRVCLQRKAPSELVSAVLRMIRYARNTTARYAQVVGACTFCRRQDGDRLHYYMA